MYINELLKFARMLSVSVIRFEDRFCVSRKVRHWEVGGWLGVTLWMIVHGGCCGYL